MKNFLWAIVEFWFEIKRKAILVILYIRFAAFIKCPCCKGEGGAMTGYYEPEWDDCNCCSFAWEYSSKRFFHKLACDYELFGRISPSKWLKCKMSFSGDVSIGWIRVIKCKLGRHVSLASECGGTVCAYCWKELTP